MINKCYKSFVNGKFLPSQSTKTKHVNVTNPATGSVNYSFEIADKKVLEEAILTSQEAFKIWSNITGIERSRILNRAVSIIRSNIEELSIIEVEDTGKPLTEALSVDIPSASDALEFFAGLAPTIHGTQQHIGKDFYYTRREPLGVCAGIGAWNYPLQIACWKSSVALACGNTMIFKPSEETPLTALKLAEIFIQAGVPKGVFNVILGGKIVGKWLTEDKRISKVSFTGSVESGKSVMRSCSGTLKKITMELGGKSPLIIFKDADLDDSINAAIQGNFYTQGEICTNCTRVFVQDEIYESFLLKLKKIVENNIIIGDPKDKKTNYGPLISKRHLQNVLNYIQSGIDEGAKLLCGGYPLYPKGFEDGFFISPTVFFDCKDSMKIVREEIFGPVMSILKFSDENEVISRANNTSFGLASGIFTSNIKTAHTIAHELQSGICWINTYGKSPVEMPVGGYKDSGIGRENGVETIDEYTQLKSIYVGLEKLDDIYGIK